MGEIVYQMAADVAKDNRPDSAHYRAYFDAVLTQSIVG